MGLREPPRRAVGVGVASRGRAAGQGRAGLGRAGRALIAAGRRRTAPSKRAEGPAGPLLPSLVSSRRIPRPEPCCTGDTTSTTVRASRPGAEAPGAVRGRPGMGWRGAARSCASGFVPVPVGRSGSVSVRGSLCGVVVRTVPALSSAPAVSRSAAPCRHRRPSFHTHGEMLWGLGCFVLPFISAFLESPRCAQQKA